MSLTYSYSGSNATVTGHSGTLGNLTIPSTVENEMTFYNVTSIGVQAFASASSLTSVTIPNSVTSIGDNAFRNATSLTSVTFAENSNVETIGDEAFYKSGITSITIPASVTALGTVSANYGTFEECSSLTTVNFEPGSQLQTIGKYAFYNSGITSITIPASVTTIYHAFYNARSLASVTFAENSTITNIEGYAFRQTGLTSVTIPNSVTTIGAHAFRQTGLTSVTIPNSVTSIGDQAFRDATSLTSVTFAENSSLETIGIQAFQGIASNPTFTWYNITSIPPVFSGKLPYPRNDTFEDTIGPAITLNGASTISLTVGDNYTELSANVVDNVDGNSTIVPSSGSVDTTTAGIYNLTYTATDAANNTSSKTRTVYVYDANGNICFLAGTPIQTNQGKIPIEKLNPKIHTIRGKTIQAITKTITPDDSLICFEPNSLGNNLPSQKTVISMNHKIFYQGKMTKAKYFTGNAGIYKIPYKQETLYNVLLDSHDKMIVNNMICETLNPRNTIAQLYMSLKKIPEEKHASVFSQYNAFCKEHNIYGTDTSRPKSKGAAFRPKL